MTRTAWLWEGMVDERARRMLAALVEARDELGRWPFAEEWEQSGRKPSRRSFVRYFGSWEEACRAAATDHASLTHSMDSDRDLLGFH